jgi:hypothetical protein
MDRSPANLAADAPRSDFQRAAAEAALGARSWTEMTQAEQARAIYARLRRIDIERAASISFCPGRPSRYPAAGETSKRGVPALPQK